MSDIFGDTQENEAVDYLYKRGIRNNRWIIFATLATTVVVMFNVYMLVKDWEANRGVPLIIAVATVCLVATITVAIDRVHKTALGTALIYHEINSAYQYFAPKNRGKYEEQADD